MSHYLREYRKQTIKLKQKYAQMNFLTLRFFFNQTFFNRRPIANQC
jgi:hypothetical protein